MQTALKYKLAEDTIDKEDLADMISWLQGEPWLTMGPLVKEFEQKWSSWLGTRHSCYVNSGSSANLLMYYTLMCSGRLKNNKVIVPAVSWATSVAPALQLGFEPIMCDAEETTFGLCPVQLERLLEEHQPGAVLLVHVLGVPCQMDKIMALKEKYGFFLMEDTCASMGSQYDNRLVGTFGELSSFSLYFGHHLSTMEGGMVSTNDDQFQEILLHLRSHGWAKDLSPEREAELAKEVGALDFNRRFTFYYPGFNVRATDLQARFGLRQMLKIPQVFARRTENHRIYQEELRGVEGLHFARNENAVICSIAFSALATDTEQRSRIAAHLATHGAETRPLGGGNMSRQPFWKNRYGSQVFSVADRIHDCAFQLPNHPSLSTEDVRSICKIVREAIQG
jgi:CDP-6-deoxy-D-xylo-4-hexulose-3-dehydrase